MGGRAPGPSGMADLRSTTLMMEYSNTRSNQRHNESCNEHLDYGPEGLHNPIPNNNRHKRRLYSDGVFHDTHDGRGELLYYPRGYHPHGPHPQGNYHPSHPHYGQNSEYGPHHGFGMASGHSRYHPCSPCGTFGGGFGSVGFGGGHFGDSGGGPYGGYGGYRRGSAFNGGPENGRRRESYPSYVPTEGYELGDINDPGHPNHKRLKDKRSAIEEEEFTEGEKVGIFDFPGRHDTARDWVGALSCYCIIAGLIGILQTYGLFILTISLTYDLSLIHAVICGATTYALVIWFGPISAMMVKGWGNRWPAVIGLFFFAVGLILDAFQINAIVLFLAHIILMGIGGSMAYTAAVTQNSDHFRKNLVASMIMIGVSSALGTALIYYLGRYLLYNIGYFWTIITQAIGIVLLMFVALLLSNKTDFDPDLNADDKFGDYKAYSKTSKKTRKEKIKECITKTVEDCDPNLQNLKKNSRDKEKSG